MKIKWVVLFITLLINVYFFNNYSLAKEEQLPLKIINKNIDKFLKKDSIMYHKNNYKAPIIKSKLKENLTKLNYEANLIELDKNSYNFLVFYILEENKEIELFRTRIYNSGLGVIDDEKTLSKIKNNSEIFARVESFYINDNIFNNYKISQKSEVFYTPKSYKLEIVNDDENLVFYKSDVEADYENIDNYILVPIKDLYRYSVNNYYTYSDSLVYVDDKYVSPYKNNLKIPYKAQKIKIKLAKNMKNWNKITISYPDFMKIENKEIFVKNGSNFKDFYNENKNQFLISKIPLNYTFEGFYIDENLINEQNFKINKDIDIIAKFGVKAKIIINNKEVGTYSYLTGDKLDNIDISKYNKKYYVIKDFTVKYLSTGKSKIIKNFKDFVINDILEITPNYEQEKVLLKIRQDDYNSRFGEVDTKIKNRDIEYPKNKPLGELLDELRKQIKANKGYDLVFRINKNELKNNDVVLEDSVLEIYFKKNQENWITVKFIGDGIDKFLSDGQEVLVGDKLDYINLPTSNGTQKKLVGWKVNRNYNILIDDKMFSKNNKELLNLNDISNIIAQKDDNLIFTAKYLESYKIEVINSVNGAISINKNNSFTVLENDKIGNYFNKNSLIINPKSHYLFSHFTSTLPITVKNSDGSVKIIPLGKKISIKDFYNIVPKSNLTFYSHFKFNDNFNFDYSRHYFDIDNLRNFNILDNTNQSNIIDALGPIVYLR